MNAGRCALIWKNLDPDPAKPNMEIGSARTTSKGQNDPKLERANLPDETYGKFNEEVHLTIRRGVVR